MPELREMPPLKAPRYGSEKNNEYGDWTLLANNLSGANTHLESRIIRNRGRPFTAFGTFLKKKPISPKELTHIKKHSELALNYLNDDDDDDVDDYDNDGDEGDDEDGDESDTGDDEDGDESDTGDDEDGDESDTDDDEDGEIENTISKIKDDELPYTGDINDCFIKCYHVYLNMCDSWAEFSQDVVDHHLMC